MPTGVPTVGVITNSQQVNEYIIFKQLLKPINNSLPFFHIITGLA